MNPFVALLVIACLLFVAATFLFVEVALFRLACQLSGVPRPTIRHSVLLVGILLIVPGVIDGFTYAVLQTLYRAGRYPLWEADIVSFFIALPVHMGVCSVIHAKVMRIPTPDGIGVWFVEKLLKLGILAVILSFVGLAVLLGRVL